MHIRTVVGALVDAPSVKSKNKASPCARSVEAIGDCVFAFGAKQVLAVALRRLNFGKPGSVPPPVVKADTLPAQTSLEGGAATARRTGLP